MKRLLAVITAITVGTTTAQAQSGTWFVQVFRKNPDQKVFLDEGADPGRIEIFEGDRFLNCAQAFSIQDWKGSVQSPISIGFVFTGDRSKIRVVKFGEMKNTPLEVKITSTP